MILSAAKRLNVDDYLVYARTGTVMIERRGEWACYRKYRDGKKRIKEKGFINETDYLKAMIPQLASKLRL